MDNITDAIKNGTMRKVPWMNDVKQQEFDKLLLTLKELKLEKEKLRIKRNQLQEEMDHITEEYEELLKKILEMLSSNIEAFHLSNMNTEELEQAIQDGKVKEDNFALDIDRGDPIFTDEK